MPVARPHRRLLPSLAMALAALAAGTAPLQAQSAAAPGVVIRTHQESTSRNVMAQGGAQDAAEAGVDGAMLSQLFDGVLDGALVGAAEVPELAAMIPDDLVNKLRLGGMFAAYEIDGVLRDARTPDNESGDYTIFIRPDVFRMDADGQALVWIPASGGGRAAMYVSNPETGGMEYLDLSWANQGFGSAAEHSGVDPAPTGQTRQILGHTAHHYTYTYSMDVGIFGPMGAPPSSTDDAALPSARNEVTGELWVAPDMPQAAEISAFYANFASSFGGGMLGGQTGVMADLAALGVPLAGGETLETYLLSGLPGTEERTLVMESVSSFEVTEVSERVLTDEEMFGDLLVDGELPEPPADGVAAGGESAAPGAPSGTAGSGSGGPVRQECDCSCKGFEELQNMDENDPDAMAKAMCARQCMMQWATCVGCDAG